MKNIMKRRNKKGFTIVELVIVIGVIGILSAILIPTFVGVTNNAKEAQLKANLANAYSAYAAEAADGVVDGTELKIEFKSQDAVGLSVAEYTSGDGAFYTYSAGWNTGTSKKPTDKTPTLVVAGNVLKSTFGGYIFYYFA